MDYKFANRVQALKPSVIREILKYTSDPEIISLAAGNPASEAFPVKEVAEISAKIFNENPIDALQYSVTEGYTPLRNRLKERMQNKYNSFNPDIDELIVTSGAQQAIELTTKSLCNEGDVIICESPSFIGSLNAFRSFGARLRGVDLESDGMNLTQLENVLKEEPNAKMIYIIPNFQNPSGITTSFEKRKAIYELAKKYGVIILEDNPYGEIRIDGEDVPNIKSLDTEGIVVYAGTFSKILSSGMRVGWCIAPKALCSKIIVCKQTSDVHSNIWAQMVAEKYMADYDLDAHIQSIKVLYKNKMNLMLDQLKKNMPEGFTWHVPQGGLFVWCTLPDSIDMMEYSTAAVQNKVAVVPGNAFLTDENEPCHAIRLNFSTPSDEKIIKGIEILGQVARDFLNK